MTPDEKEKFRSREVEPPQGIWTMDNEIRTHEEAVAEVAHTNAMQINALKYFKKHGKLPPVYA